MRTTFLLGAFIASTAAAPAALPPSAKTTLSDHLLEVNAQWRAQDPRSFDAQGTISFANEADRIARHLHMVRERLTARSADGLSAEQLGNRLFLLTKLDAYADRGLFPQNYVLPYRNPIFIDPHGTACAVGQLIIESGHRDLAERISSEMNLAYVLDMPSSPLWPEIAAWANEHGFTAEELAWIQPAYGPNLPWAPLGGGTNGTVRVMKKLNNGDVLLAGDFTEAGGTPANGVAIWNGTGYTALGAGVQGIVNSVVEFNGEIHLGGAEFPGFNDLAKWDGTYWTFSMVFQGKYPLINALHVHNNTLYAAGAMSGFAGNTDFVQRMDGSTWSAVGSAFDAPVHALATHNGTLIAGGAFTTLQTPSLPPPVLHVAELEGNEWGQHRDGLDATVRTLLDVNGTLYAGGDLYANIALAFGLARIEQGGATWEHLLPNHVSYMPAGAGPTWIGSLADHNGEIYFGGNFSIAPLLGTYGNNLGLFHGSPDAVEALILLDQQVNCIAIQDQYLIIGGAFQAAYPHVATLDLTTGMSRADQAGFVLAPNPTTDILRITRGDMDTERMSITITDVSGRVITTPLQRSAENITIDVRSLPAGSYQVHVEAGSSVSAQRFVKQ